MDEIGKMEEFASEGLPLGEPANVKIQTNPEGRLFLQDYDDLIQELQEMERRMKMHGLADEAIKIWNVMCEAQGWDPKTIQDRGLSREFFHGLTTQYSSRIRHMREQRRATDESIPEDDEQIRLFIQRFNVILHSPCFTLDLRAAEYFANWAESLVGDDNFFGWGTNPRLRPRTVILMFEGTYMMPFDKAQILSRFMMNPLPLTPFFHKKKKKKKKKDLTSKTHNSNLID